MTLFARQGKQWPIMGLPMKEVRLRQDREPCMGFAALSDSQTGLESKGRRLGSIAKSNMSRASIMSRGLAGGGRFSGKVRTRLSAFLSAFPRSSRKNLSLIMLAI